MCIAYFLFSCHQDLFIFLFYRITVSWLSYLVSMRSLVQHVCCFSAAIAHLLSFWCFGNLQESYCFLEDIRAPFDCKQQLKRSPYKVILSEIRAKHSANSLKVFICNFCLSSNASLSWLGTSFFPRVHHLWIRCISMHTWMVNQNIRVDLLHISHSYNLL